MAGTFVDAPQITNFTNSNHAHSGASSGGTIANITGNAATVSNATFTTALTVNGGTLTLTANVANSSVLTIGAGAVSVSGSNTGDQTNISGNAATVTGLSVTGGKTLTVTDSATIATNAITLGGGEVITFSATNALSLLTTGATSVTFPTTGTLVSTDQTTGQTIGATGARLTKLWALDLTVTNAIAGSVTGSAASATGNAGTATALQTARLINGTSFDGSANITNNFPEGFLINGKIVPSVASNNLTVALKGMDGNDPSATNPVYVRIGDAVRTVTAALSAVGNAGTNWLNLGGAETAAKEQDLFVYLGFKVSNSTVGITVSRIPYALVHSEFDEGDATHAKSYIEGGALASTDSVRVVGRFAATLSAGAGYTWTIPTFTSANLVQNTIHETRWLTWLPSGAGYTAGAAIYKVRNNTLDIIIDSTANITGNSSTPMANTNVADTQLNTDTGTAVIAKNTATITVASNPQNIAGSYPI